MSDSLADLVSTIEEIDRLDEDDLALDATAVRRLADGTLELDLDLCRGRSLHSRWIVTAATPCEINVSLGRHEWITVESDHPLLLDHTDEQGQLYLGGPVGNPGDALSAIWLAHREAVGDWRSLTRYLNTLVDPLELLRRGIGVLASGPMTLLRAYAAAMSVGEVGSLLSTGPPKRWDEELMWVVEDRPLVVLVLQRADALAVGRNQVLASWVVASEVAARRVG